MTEVLFYHLVKTRMEDVLPDLLEKSLQREWRAVIHGGNRDHLEALDASLWTHSDDGFLPHGMGASGEGAEQPIWLTDQDDNPNEAQIRFLIDGASIENADDYERLVYMFDGHDEDALSGVRERWKIEKEAGHDVTYWTQNERGGWDKKA